MGGGAGGVKEIILNRDRFSLKHSQETSYQKRDLKVQITPETKARIDEKAQHTFEVCEHFEEVRNKGIWCYMSLLSPFLNIAMFGIPT